MTYLTTTKDYICIIIYTVQINDIQKCFHVHSLYISYVMMMSSVPRSDPLLLVLEDVGQLSSRPLNRGVHWSQVLLVFVGLYVVL